MCEQLILVSFTIETPTQRASIYPFPQNFGFILLDYRTYYIVHWSRTHT